MTYEDLGAIGQPNVLTARESAAKLHHLGVVRAWWPAARATAVRMPPRVPPLPSQHHERTADDVADRLVDRAEQIIRAPHQQQV